MTYGYDPNQPPPPPPRQQQAPAYGAYPQPPAYPYGVPPSPPPTPRKSRKRLAWVLAGTGALLAVLCCGGFGGLAYFGLNLVKTEVRNQVRDHPVVVEHIGEIQTFDINLTESGAAADSDTFVYEVAGTKGRGVLTVKHVTDDDGAEQIVSAKLRLPDGQEHDVTPE